MTVNATSNEERGMGSFLTIWVGQVFSLLGSELVQFALIWYLTLQTQSATVLATVAAFQMLPNVFIGPFAGALVDRWNRRWTMIGADALVAAATLVLAILFATGTVQVWHIYVILLIRSTGKVFHQPAMSATTPLMVPKQHLTRVAGLNQSLQGVMMLFAPVLGALVIGVLPMQGILAIDILTALIAIAPLLFVFVPQPERSVDAAATNVLQDMAAGFRYVWSWTGLMIILAMACLINMLLNPAFSLLPLYVSNYFGKGALELGWTQSAFGIGIIAGGITLGVWGGFKKRVYTAMLGLILMGITVIGMGVLPSTAFIGLLVASVVMGIMQVMTNGSLGAVLQATVKPEMQGRVMALIMSLATALSPVGLLAAGPLADRFGVGSWFVIGGICCALMGAAGLIIPATRNIEGDAATPSTPASDAAITPALSESAAIAEGAAD